MLITAPNLVALRSGFRSLSQGGLDQVESQYAQIFIYVTSTTY